MLNSLCYLYFFCGLFLGLMFAAVLQGAPEFGVILALGSAICWMVAAHRHPKPENRNR